MIVFKLDVQGRVVVQDYRQVRSDGAEFSAHGVFMIISDDSRIGWWLFDSYGQPPEPATGSWLDQKLIMEKTTPRGVARHTFSIEDEKLIYRIELKTRRRTRLPPVPGRRLPTHQRALIYLSSLAHVRVEAVVLSTLVAKERSIVR